jgi:hypothetical protein
MDWNPPPGSNISMATDRADPTIIIPNSGSALRYFHCAFLLFWLGMWTIGFRQAAAQVISGTANGFVIFWLGGWTIGGFFAVAALYRMLRPTVPESLELGSNGVAYDSGIAPLQFDTSYRAKKPKQVWNSVFPKRIRVELDRRQLQSLRLRETDSGNRLTIDVDAARIEIAPAASEVEREWLARLLAQRYGISQLSAAPAAAPVG